MAPVPNSALPFDKESLIVKIAMHVWILILSVIFVSAIIGGVG